MCQKRTTIPLDKAEPVPTAILGKMKIWRCPQMTEPIDMLNVGTTAHRMVDLQNEFAEIANESRQVDTVIR